MSDSKKRRFSVWGSKEGRYGLFRFMGNCFRNWKREKAGDWKAKPEFTMGFTKHLAQWFASDLEYMDEFIYLSGSLRGKSDLMGWFQWFIGDSKGGIGWSQDKDEANEVADLMVSRIRSLLLKHKDADMKPSPDSKPKHVEREEDPYAAEDDDPEEDKPKSYNQRKAERLERQRKAQEEQGRKAEKEFKRGPDREGLHQKEIREIDL